MVYRWSKSGRYLACSGYPDCKSTLPVDKDGKPITMNGSVKCPNCGKDMLLRQSRFGLFLGCSGYPECKTNMPCSDKGEPLKTVKEEDIKETCELCGKAMQVRRKGRRAFLGCSGYPECKTNMPCSDKGEPLKTVKEEDIKETCELCGKAMRVRRKGRRAFLGCSGYPECDNTRPLPEGIRLASKPKQPTEPAGIDCEKCGKPMVIRSGRRGKFIACSGFPRCRNTKPLPESDEQSKAKKEKESSS